MWCRLVFIGIALTVIGLFWPWLVKLPLGRMPGDILIGRLGLEPYIPIATLIFLDLLTWLLIWLFIK